MLRAQLCIGLLGICGMNAAIAQSIDDSQMLSSDRFHGVAKPAQMADLPSLVPGIIAEVHVREGQAVKKGTPLVTLDDRVPKARLAAATVEAQLVGALRRAEVDVKMSESRLNRLRSVFNSGAGAGFEIEAAEGVRDQAVAAFGQQRDVLKAAEANRQLTEAQLMQYTVVAPFDGVVTEIHRKSGAVDPTQLVVSIANLNTLEVEMHLPSRMVGEVRVGQKVSLSAGVPISRDIAAAIVSVSPIIDSASNTFRCLMEIDNTEISMPAGFSVVVNDDIQTGSQISQRSQ